MRRVVRSGILVGCLCLPAGVAVALNGIQVISPSAVHRALGGAGVARPLDSSALLMNPAGMTKVGQRLDVNLTVGLPTNSMNNGGGTFSSQDEGSILPSASALFPFGQDRWAFGVGIFTTSGFGVDYPTASRIAALGGAFDNADRYGLLKFIPGIAYAITPKLSAGLGLHVNYAFFQSNSATGAGTQTTGRGRFDPAVGLGFEVGLLYEPLEWLAAGLTYTSRQFFEQFDRYTDILPDGFDMPPQVAAGLAFVPFRGARVLTDFRWINWDDVGLLGNAPATGALGWRDQYVIATGFQYDFAESNRIPLAVRAGYNYARSLIPPSAAFSNILVPGIGEHHLTGGASYTVSEKVGVDVAYTWMLPKTVTDDGSGGGVAGTNLKSSAQIFAAQLHVNF